MTSDISQNKHSVNSTSTPAKIIGQLFDYYKGREYSLVNLLRSKGVTNTEIASALGIDPTLISRNWPKGGSK